MLTLKFSTVLPFWLFIPDDEYEVAIYNQDTEVNEIRKLLIQNNMWRIDSINQYGEFQENIFASEHIVINSETLKINLNHKNAFQSIFGLEYDCTNFTFFPSKVKSQVNMEYKFQENLLPKNDFERNNYIRKVIITEILPFINKFLETYKFFIAEDKIIEVNYFRKPLRSNNVQNLSFYDLHKENTYIFLEGGGYDRNLSTDIFNTVFESGFPSYTTFKEPLKLFKENLKKKGLRSIEIIWGELKNSVFKFDWRKSFIFADTLIEAIKTQLNAKTRQEVLAEFRRHPQGFYNSEIVLRLLVDKLKEKEDRGVKFFLDEQVPIFYSNLINADDNNILKKIHNIRNQIVHRARSNIPIKFEAWFSSFQDIFKRLYGYLYHEMPQEKLKQLATHFVVQLKEDRSMFQVEPFHYKTQYMLHSINNIIINHIKDLIDLKIETLFEPEIILRDFAETYRIKSVRSKKNIHIFIPYSSLEAKIFENIFNSINLKIVSSKITYNDIYIYIYGFKIPNQYQNRLIDAFLHTFRETNANQINFTELCPVDISDRQWQSIHLDYYYIDFLNNIGVKYLELEKWDLALIFFNKAISTANLYNLKKREARGYYNLACLNSLISNLGLSKQMLLYSIDLDDEIKFNWLVDSDLDNLINSGTITYSDLLIR